MAGGEGFQRFVNGILNESESEEEFGGSDSEEEDNVEVSNKDSESEQSADEIKVNEDDEMDEDLRFYIYATSKCSTFGSERYTCTACTRSKASR